MSTHYDLYLSPSEPGCPTCGRGDEPEVLPFAQLGAGWRVKVHVLPDRGLHGLSDWLPLLDRGRVIGDDGSTLTKAGFLRQVGDREHLRSHTDHHPEHSYRDAGVDMLEGEWS